MVHPLSVGPTSSLHNTLVTRRRAYPDVNPLNRSPLHASYISRDSCATIRVGGFCAGHGEAVPPRFGALTKLRPHLLPDQTKTPYSRSMLPRASFRRLPSPPPRLNTASRLH